MMKHLFYNSSSAFTGGKNQTLKSYASRFWHIKNGLPLPGFSPLKQHKRQDSFLQL